MELGEDLCMMEFLRAVYLCRELPMGIERYCNPSVLDEINAALSGGESKWIPYASETVEKCTEIGPPACSTSHFALNSTALSITNDLFFGGVFLCPADGMGLVNQSGLHANNAMAQIASLVLGVRFTAIGAFKRLNIN